MPTTVNGFGTMFYGEAEHHPDGSFIATEWITAVFIPLIPLRSFRLIRPKPSPSDDPFQTTFKNAFTYGYDHFEVLEELPIFWPQVLRIYVFLGCAGPWYAAAIWLFFFKNNPFEQFVSHPIEATLLLILFMAALAVPLVIVQAARKRSSSAVGAAPQSFGAGSETSDDVRPAQKILAVVGAAIFILPPMIVWLLNLPPASWLNARQADFFVGRYYPLLTFMVLLFAYFAVLFCVLWLLSSLTKLLTGKKLFQLFSNADPRHSQKAPPSPSTAAPPTKREEILITHCHMCNYSIPPEHQRSPKTCPNCGADLTRRRY